MFIEDNPGVVPAVLHTLPLKDFLTSLDASFGPVINTWTKGSTVLSVTGDICTHADFVHVVAAYRRMRWGRHLNFSLYISFLNGFFHFELNCLTFLFLFVSFFVLLLPYVAVDRFIKVPIVEALH
jgi:hypothetical protein